MHTVIKKLLLLIAVACLAHAAWADSADITREDVNNVLRQLDKELNRRDEHVQRVIEGIDSVKELRSRDRLHSRAWLDHTMELAYRYTAFNNDSLMAYLKQGRDVARSVGQDSLAIAFDVRIYTYLPLYGYIDDALRGYAKYDTIGIPDNLKMVYYSAGKQLYSYVAAFYEGYADTSEYWRDKALESQMELLKTLDPASQAYRVHYGESLLMRRRYTQARAELEPLLDELPQDINYYARVCYFLAEIAKVEGDHDGQLYYLAKSALSDAVAPTLEVTALQELGQLLYRDGDVNRAYRYLSIALANAVECNAILRQIETSRALPVIHKANQAYEHHWRTVVYVIIGILAVLVVIFLMVLVFLRRQMRRMSVMQITLRKANKTREVYINQFLTLCTIYIEKLKQYNNMVNRKLSAGQADELYKSTKTGKFIEEQVREFYNLFDDAFLHIYPTFVADINALMQPDKQIVLRDGELLNTDLRILAFMRLGIEDATRVAQILNYSVNTIYTYRNKLRNRAISRDTFESDVMRTGVV